MSLLNKASLIVVPSGYKEGTLYSAKPINGDGDLSFTRATNGTRINSEGLVEVTPWNLLEYSEQFTSAAWATSNGATVSADQTTAPNGTTTADKIVFPANSAANIYNFPTSPVGANNISVYAKTLSGTKQFRLRIDTGSGPAVSSDFTATTEWQRFDFAVTTTAANLVVYIFNDSTGVAGDLYVWGAQLNIGATAKPYFPTTDRLNVPRLTYPVGGGCPALLLEPQRTNLVTYSEQIDNAAWTKTNSPTITTNIATAPDGTVSADGIQDTTGGTFKRIRQSTSVSANSTNTASVFVKKETIQTNFGGLALTYTGGTAKFAYAIINPVDGTIVVSSDSVIGATSTKAEDYGNWWRFFLTATDNGGNTNLEIAYYATISTNGTSTGVGIGSVRTIWGFQLEIGATYATSYIPTYGASSTRSQDSCSKTGISSLIGQTEGTLFFDANFDDSDTVNFSISDGTSSNYVLIDTTSARSVFARVQQGGVTQVQINTTSSFYSVGERLKCAIAYKSNDFAFYINGTSIGTDNSGSVPALDQLRFSRWNGALAATQRINQAILFPTRLTNDELASLTTL